MYRRLSDPAGSPWPRRGFERRGDVLVTPWSVRLGPIGLQPSRVSPEHLTGTWRHGAEEVEVRLEEPPAPPWGAFGEPEGRPVVGFRPDAFGVVSRLVPFRGHAPMGHADYSLHELWFATGEDRLVRLRSSGGCGGLTPSRGPDAFERVTSTGR